MFGQRSVNDGGQFLLAERVRQVNEFLVHGHSYLTFRPTSHRARRTLIRNLASELTPMEELYPNAARQAA